MNIIWLLCKVEFPHLFGRLTILTTMRKNALRYKTARSVSFTAIFALILTDENPRLNMSYHVAPSNQNKTEVLQSVSLLEVYFLEGIFFAIGRPNCHDRWSRRTLKL